MFTIRLVNKVRIKNLVKNDFGYNQFFFLKKIKVITEDKTINAMANG